MVPGGSREVVHKVAPVARSTAATRLTKRRLAKAVRPSEASAMPATALCVSGAASGISRPGVSRPSWKAKTRTTLSAPPLQTSSRPSAENAIP